MRVKTTGQYSMDSRLKYREVTPNALSDTLAAELSAQFPGVRVLGLSVSALEDLNAPVEIEVAFSAEDYLKSMQDYALCPMPNDEFTDYAEIFAAASRQFPLDLSYPMQMTKTVTISLPDGWTATLPSDREMVEPFGTMRREYRMEDNRIVYRLDFSLQSPTIAPEDYPAARRFFNNLAQEDKTQLILHENGRPKV